MPYSVTERVSSLGLLPRRRIVSWAALIILENIAVVNNQLRTDLAVSGRHSTPPPKYPVARQVLRRNAKQDGWLGGFAGALWCWKLFHVRIHLRAPRWERRMPKSLIQFFATIKWRRLRASGRRQPVYADSVNGDPPAHFRNSVVIHETPSLSLSYSPLAACPTPAVAFIPQETWAQSPSPLPFLFLSLEVGCLNPARGL